MLRGPPWHTVLSIAPLMKLQGLPAGTNANRQLQRVSQGLLTWGWTRAEKKNRKQKQETTRSKHVFALVSQKPPTEPICDYVHDRVGGLHYWWHICNRKRFGALWTRSLKRLIDCGGWLTLERRQPVSLTFSFNLWSFFVCALSEGVKGEIFVLTWESQEERGTWPHLQCIMSNTQ